MFRLLRSEIHSVFYKVPAHISIQLNVIEIWKIWEDWVKHYDVLLLVFNYNKLPKIWPWNKKIKCFSITNIEYMFYAFHYFKLVRIIQNLLSAFEYKLNCLQKVLFFSKPKYTKIFLVNPMPFTLKGIFTHLVTDQCVLNHMKRSIWRKQVSMIKAIIWYTH